MQAQVLLNPTLKIQENNLLNEYVDVIVPLDDPQNLFLNLNNIMDPDSKDVYFFSYSMGKRKVVMWGYYNKNSAAFTAEGTCRYNLAQLNAMIKGWRQNNYRPIGYSVKNKITKRVIKYLGLESDVIKRDTYLIYKYVLAFYDGKVTKEQLMNRFGSNVLDTIDNEARKYFGKPVVNDMDIYSYLEIMQEKVNEYESDLNLTVVEQSIIRSFGQIVQQLSQRFYDFIKTGKYLNSESVCPNLKDCDDGNPLCGCYYYGIKEPYYNIGDYLR
jgi:hypothetical protein